MHSPDPIAFSFLGIDIMWYGVLIAAAFMLAIFISYRRAHEFAIEKDEIINLAIVMMPLSIVGARLYYVIFSWSSYKNNPMDIFNTRSGGLAIHGGLIAGLLVSVFFCRLRKINLPDMADLIFPSVALAQSIGRWGNFFNSEAYGSLTELPWAITVNGDKVHPTFLYESLWCLLIFLFLLFLSRKRKFPGQIALLYFILYSLERFFVEELRTDSLMIGEFKQAQVLSFLVLAISCIAFVFLRKKHASVKTDRSTQRRKSK